MRSNNWLTLSACIFSSVYAPNISNSSIDAFSGPSELSVEGSSIEDAMLAEEPAVADGVMPYEETPELEISELDSCVLLHHRYLFGIESVCLEIERKVPAGLGFRWKEWPKESCHFLENFYHRKRYQAPARTSPGMIPSPPAPTFPHKSTDGVPELVPIPCKPCDQDRKDRHFIRGSPFSGSMTKLLVDYASGPSGGKVLAFSDGMRGAADVVHTDDNRYLLTPCSNKVWLTIRLGDEVFIEKIGITSNELFASTFRHIQVLGSRQYPTNEWRVLGEIETNPVETHEWFDLSGSSQCSKCYVKYLKIRVLTHHALEGYTHCALTRIQVFGSTVLQSLDRIQSMNSSVTESGTGTSQVPAFVKLGNRGAALMDSRFRSVLGQEPVLDDSMHSDTAATPSAGGSNHHGTAGTTSPPTSVVEEGTNPLLNLIEELTALKRQYASVANSVYNLNENVKSQSNSHSGLTDKVNQTSSFPGSEQQTGIRVSVLGVSFAVPKLSFPDSLTVVLALLVVSQVCTAFFLFRRSVPANPKTLVVSLGDGNTPTSRRFSAMRGALVPQSVQFKKRSHGLWRPKARRALYNQIWTAKKSISSSEVSENLSRTQSFKDKIIEQ